MKRVRYLQLAKFADDICVKLMNEKIKPHEGCVVRRIAETQWDNMRASYNEIHGAQMSNQVEACEAPLTADSEQLTDNIGRV